MRLVVAKNAKRMEAEELQRSLAKQAASQGRPAGTVNAARRFDARHSQRHAVAKQRQREAAADLPDRFSPQFSAAVRAAATTSSSADKTDDATAAAAGQEDASQYPLRGLRVCVNPGNGCGGLFATAVLEPLGADGFTGSKLPK